MGRGGQKFLIMDMSKDSKGCHRYSLNISGSYLNTRSPLSTFLRNPSRFFVMHVCGGEGKVDADSGEAISS